MEKVSSQGQKKSEKKTRVRRGKGNLRTLVVTSDKAKGVKYVTEALFSIDAKKEALKKEEKFAGLTVKDLKARKKQDQKNEKKQKKV